MQCLEYSCVKRAQFGESDLLRQFAGVACTEQEWCRELEAGLQDPSVPAGAKETSLPSIEACFAAANASFS
jgi:hypothetical protein